MALTRYIADSVWRGGFDKIATATEQIIAVCDDADFSNFTLAEISPSNRLLSSTMVTGVGNGDYTQSSNVLTIPDHVDVEAVNSGTANCVVLHDGIDILLITPIADFAVYIGAYFTLKSFTFTFTEV